MNLSFGESALDDEQIVSMTPRTFKTQFPELCETILDLLILATDPVSNEVSKNDILAFFYYCFFCFGYTYLSIS